MHDFIITSMNAVTEEETTTTFKTRKEYVDPDRCVLSIPMNKI